MADRKSRMFGALKSKFVNLPQEELILVQRKHWSVFAFPGIITLLAVSLSFIPLIFLYSIYPSLFPIFITASLLIFLFTVTAILKSIIDWHFNLYVVTNRKIAEVTYRPLSSRLINEVLLDQVRCTEIDTTIEGIIGELLDFGDVIITFDRPTHQEQFVLASIPSPKKIEAYLHQALSPLPPRANPSYLKGNGEDNGWYVKDKENLGKWKYVEEIKTRHINGERGGETIWNL